MNQRRIAICVIGNVASGKTSVCEKLIRQLPHFRYWAIDAYRRKYNLNNSFFGEHKANAQLYQDTQKQHFLLLECAGFTEAFEQWSNAFSDMGGELFVFRLQAPLPILLQRYEQRLQNGYQAPPFPYAATIEPSMRLFESKLNSMGGVVIDSVRNSPNQIAEQIMSTVRKIL